MAASKLSDDFANAASAVGAKESLERPYRLEPGPEIRASDETATAALVAAVADVRRDGDPGDRALVAQVLTKHTSYLAAIDRTFAAVDRGDTATVLAIDGDEVDPSFEAIQQPVLTYAVEGHDVASPSPAELLRGETITRQLTPLVFLCGVALAAFLGSIVRAHRRLLDVERELAVHEALRDRLTGLPNRTLLANRFTQALQSDARTGSHTALLLIDLDQFKDINDTFGHHYGDELLAMVGPRLSSMLREVDTVARMGGDEFAVLPPGVATVNSAALVASNLLTVLESLLPRRGS